MAAFSPTPSALTLLIFFAVAPERQTDVFQLNVNATEQTIRHFPGFLGGVFHQSLDGARMAEYIQWRSPDDFAAARQRPDFSEHLPHVFALAELDFARYEVVSGISRRQGEQEERASPTIAADRTIATIIARYTVEPQEQLPLTHQLQQQLDQRLHSAPGWLSTSLLREVDGTRVVAYLQVQKAGDDAAATLAQSLATVGAPYAACDVHQYTVDWVTPHEP
jgi:antibiotic biosynthesis monooxygenase (ABM) superfamily enzyme